MAKVLIIAREIDHTFDDGVGMTLDIYELDTEHHGKKDFKHWYSKMRRILRKEHGYLCTIEVKKPDAEPVLSRAYFARRMYEDLRARKNSHSRIEEKMLSDLQWYIWDTQALNRGRGLERKVPM